MGQNPLQQLSVSLSQGAVAHHYPSLRRTDGYLLVPSMTPHGYPRKRSKKFQLELLCLKMRPEFLRCLKIPERTLQPTKIYISIPSIQYYRQTYFITHAFTFTGHLKKKASYIIIQECDVGMNPIIITSSFYLKDSHHIVTNHCTVSPSVQLGGHSSTWQLQPRYHSPKPAKCGHEFM